ncbi:PPE family protein [Mycolicibacterium sp. Dal123E01]|uniref:PPE family protein n=1 Tax=Mycolicibacterium sp. Dal123E01 TaxID=3457578 RepID=UPI00403EF684
MATEWRIWLGAGALALGAGTALVIGSGVAHADSAGTGSAGTGSAGTAHHQKRTAGPAAPTQRPAAVKVAQSPSGGATPKSRIAATQVRANAAGDTPLVVQDKEIAEQDKAIDQQKKEFGQDVKEVVADFSTTSPEINSTRLYSGAGSSSLLSAASAWNGLANDLNATAQGFERASLGLSSATWAGPVSSAMAATAHGYAGWLAAAAAQSESAAGQASAVAGAFETAFAAGVPPQVTAANRAQLAQLTASNFFSGNLPAIAATEAMYAGMWAQDVSALVGYHPVQP